MKTSTIEFLEILKKRNPNIDLSQVNIISGPKKIPKNVQANVKTQLTNIEKVSKYLKGTNNRPVISLKQETFDLLTKLSEKTDQKKSVIVMALIEEKCRNLDIY